MATHCTTMTNTRRKQETHQVFTVSGRRAGSVSPKDFLAKTQNSQSPCPPRPTRDHIMPPPQSSQCSPKLKVPDSQKAGSPVMSNISALEPRQDVVKLNWDRTRPTGQGSRGCMRSSSATGTNREQEETLQG